MVFCSPQLPRGAPSCRLSFHSCSVLISTCFSFFFCLPHSVFASSGTDVKTHIGWIKRVRMRDGAGEAQVIYEPFHKTIKEKLSLVPQYSWVIPFCDGHHYSHQDNIPFYLLSLLFQGIKAEFHACFQSSLGVKTVPEHKQPGFNASSKKERGLWAADTSPPSIRSEPEPLWLNLN